MPSAWSHLPNADRIDQILADLKKQPKAWSAAEYAAESAAGAAAWAAVRNSARSAVWVAASAAARDAAWDAILALIAWDDSADLLDSDPDHVLTLALLGNPPAVLLLPAVRILNQRKLENATSADLEMS